MHSNPQPSPPPVRVIWHQLAGDDRDREAAAREVATVVLGLPQRPVDAPVLPSAAPGEPGSEPPAWWRTKQSTEPLTYQEADERFAGLQGNEQLVDAALLLSDGTTIKRKASERDGRRRSVAPMPASGPQRKKRKPMTINVRPGQGGMHRRLAGEDYADPLDGIESYGDVTWIAANGGAWIGFIELDNDGDTICAARLSSEDRNERLVDQIRPALAMCKQHDLRPRMIVLAVNMSGTREVRGDRESFLPPEMEGRDDLHFIDDAEWCQNVVWRDGDRIARDVIPGETVLRRWKRRGVGLWLAACGRQMDYDQDRLLLRAMMMISAEERESTTRRLQMAAVNKGPLRGVGHLGPCRFGFVRNPANKQQEDDPEQFRWIHRLFEIADSGECLEGGLSTRKVTDVLAAEGCTFDHDRVRKILQDPVYATGEMVTYVRGIPVPARAKVSEPVPLDRFQRVQDLMALRQGRTSRTPLGEFLFNYVDAVHVQCADDRNHKDQRALVKGAILARARPETRRLRHTPFTPESCKGLTWDRSLLEPPVVRAVREVVTNPDLLHELALAQHHEAAAPRARLNTSKREELRDQLAALEEEQDAISDSYAAQLGPGKSADIAEFRTLVSGVRRRMETVQRRLDSDERAAAAEEADGAGTGSGGVAAGSGAMTMDDRVKTFLEILTVETPKDPRLLALRARLFQTVVSRIEIDTADPGETVINLYGHLLPKGRGIDAANPVLAAAPLLDAYALERDVAAEASPDGDVRTDLSARADKSVRSLDEVYGELMSMPRTAELERAARASLDSEGWRWRRDRPLEGAHAWRRSITLART